MKAYETLNGLLKKLKSYGIDYFLTGSFAFEVNKPDSDIDICIADDFAQWLKPEIQKVVQVLDVAEHKSSDDERDIEMIDESWTGHSFYAVFPFGNVNFIALADQQFENWQISTEAIRLKCKHNNFKEYISVKTNRIDYFRKLRKALYLKGF